MIRKIIEYSLQNRALVLAIFFVLMLLSFQYAFRVKLDALPDLSDTQVILEVRWDGRTPQVIQEQVVYPLTRYLVSLPRIKIVRATSFFDFALIYIIFEDGTDLDWARKRVDLEMRMAKFSKPQDATITIAPDETTAGWVFQYYLQDKLLKHDLAELHSINEYIVKQNLLNIPGVAEVAIVGGFKRAFQIILDPVKLFQFHIAPQEIMEVIMKNNRDEGAGIIEINEKEYMVSGKGYIKTFEELENIIIKTTRGGIPVKVKDVAIAVNLGPLQFRRGALEINGEGETTGGVVIARFKENAYSICKKIKEKIIQLNKSLAKQGIEIKVAYDRSLLIKRSINVLLEELIQIIATLFVVIIVFILHLPSTIITWLVLPVAVIITFATLSYFNISSNIMSIGGIAIALGDIADGVISLIEDVHKRKEREGDKKSLHTLVMESTTEIGPGIFASLLVLSVSFLPVFALKGQAGRLFYPLAFTKIISLLVASILTITVIPIMIGLFVKGKTIPEQKNPLNKIMINIYTLVFNICFRYKVIFLFIAFLLLISTYYPISRMGTEFLPALEEGDILYMPTSVPGMAVQPALKVIKKQNQILKTFPEVEVVWGKVGRADTATDPAPIEMFETTVKLKPYHSWPKRIVVEQQIEKFLKSILTKYNLLDDKLENLLPSIEKSIKKKFEYEFRMNLLKSSYNEASRASKPILEKELQSVLEINGVTKLSDAERKELKEFVENISLRQVKSIFELMYEEMDRELQFPGFPNIWSMPIRVRLDMLSTGIRSPIGVKIYGPDLKKLEEIGTEIERLLKNDSDTISAISMRLGSGYYIKIEPDRQKCARLGINISDIYQTIRLAVAGEPISEIIDGIFRYGVVLRYPYDYREDIEKLKHLYINSPYGIFTIGEVADIKQVKDVSSILTENSLPTLYIFITPQSKIAISKYVYKLRNLIEEKMREKFPAGYNFSISGQYEYMLQMYSDLKIILPLAVIIVFIILYFVVKDFWMTLILLTTLSFSLIGSFWFLYLKGFNLSIAVYSGLLVLLGFASQTAIIMHVFLDEAIARHLKGRDKMSVEEFKIAVYDGAVLRVRPKIMSVATSVFGLLPIVLSSAKEASIMTQLAAPMVGGMITSTLHTLLLVPVYFYLYYKKRFTTE